MDYFDHFDSFSQSLGIYPSYNYLQRFGKVSRIQKNPKRTTGEKQNGVRDAASATLSLIGNYVVSSSLSDDKLEEAYKERKKERKRKV